MLLTAAARNAEGDRSAGRYQRHRPEQTLLYRIVEQHYPAFTAHLAGQGRVLPEYVQREFEDYLQCGRLEHGFLRVRCDTCHAERLVAFSCKRRGFCPSCGARRMADECMDARMPRAQGSAGAAHMLFLDGVYADHLDGSTRFRWVAAPTREELTPLAHTIAHRVGRYLERQGLLERDAENSYLASDAMDEDPMNELLGHSIIYRIAVGSQAGRKVFTLQTLPACDPDDQYDDTVGKVAGFSLHAGVAAKAHERNKLERLCRYISRPAVSEKRLALTPNDNLRYQLKTPYKDGTTHVIFEPLEFMAHIPVRHPAGDLRSCKSAFLPISHCPPGGLGAQTAGQPDPLPRGVRAQQQTPCVGDPGQAGQGEQGQGIG